MLYWEEKAGEAAGRILNELVTMSNAQSPEDLSKWTLNLLTQLANAQCGKTGDASTVHKDAIAVLNHILCDEVERLVIGLEGVELGQSTGSLNGDIKGLINRKLMCANVEDGSFLKEPGDLAIVPSDKILNCDEKCLAFSNENFSSWINAIRDTTKSWEDFETWITDSKKIWVEVSPPCDYYQNKQIMSRILPGVLWPKNKFDRLNKNAGFVYISSFFIQDNNILPYPFYIVLNNRNFVTLPKNELEGLNLQATFRLRGEVLSQIRLNFSQHAMRIGLLSM